MTEQTEANHLAVFRAMDDLSEDDTNSIAITQLAANLFLHDEDEFEVRLEYIIDAIREAHAMMVAELEAEIAADCTEHRHAH